MSEKQNGAGDGPSLGELGMAGAACPGGIEMVMRRMAEMQARLESLERENAALRAEHTVSQVCAGLQSLSASVGKGGKSKNTGEPRGPVYVEHRRMDREPRGPVYVEDHRMDLRSPSMLDGGAATERVPFREAAESLTRFRGNDPARPVSTWTRAVDIRKAAYKWSQIETFLAARGALEGPARRWFESRTDLTTWDQLRDGLEKEFGQKVSVARLYEFMASRRRRQDETLLDFFQDMKALGHEGSMHEEDVVRYIIKGVTEDDNLKANLLMAKNLQELWSRFLCMEDLLNKHHNRNRGKEVPRSRPNSSAHESPRKRPRGLRCFSCGDEGHKGTDCPYKDKGLVCYKCKEPGHISRDCPKRKKESYGEFTRPRLNKISGGGNRSALEVELAGRLVIGLLDSGADVNLLRKDLFDIVQDSLDLRELCPTGRTLEGAGGYQIQVQGSVKIPTVITGVTYDIRYMVVPSKDIPVQLILGDPLLDLARVTLSREGVNNNLLTPEDFQGNIRKVVQKKVHNIIGLWFNHRYIYNKMIQKYE